MVDCGLLAIWTNDLGWDWLGPRQMAGNYLSGVGGDVARCGLIHIFSLATLWAGLRSLKPQGLGFSPG